jgi:hypothetical protein
MINISKLIVVVFASFLFSCSTAVPSISGFMNPKSEGFIDGMIKVGDLYRETPTYDNTYYQEMILDFNGGAYFRIKNFTFGSEFGLAGFKSVLGFKNNYLGSLGWLTLNPTDITFAFGAAIAEQYPFGLLDSTFRLGVYEYVNRSNIPSFEDQEMFRSPVGSKYYFESGLGMYSAISIMKTIGFVVDYKIGRQFKTHEIRLSLDLKVFYAFDVKKRKPNHRCS